MVWNAVTWGQLGKGGNLVMNLGLCLCHNIQSNEVNVYFILWVTRTLSKPCSKKEIRCFLTKVLLGEHLNIVKENRDYPFLEGYYLVNILVSFKKKMEWKDILGLTWKRQSIYLNMSFNSLTFLGGYLLAWLSLKKVLAYANGPAFT